MNRSILPLALAALSITLAGSALARGPWRANEQNTGGWYYMTPEKRIEHQARIRSFKTLDECRTYQAGHHKLMEARAREQGRPLLGGHRDICEQLRSLKTEFSHAPAFPQAARNNRAPPRRITS